MRKTSKRMLVLDKSIVFERTQPLQQENKEKENQKMEKDVNRTKKSNTLIPYENKLFSSQRENSKMNNNQIKNLRIKLGLSQKQFATILGASIGTVRRWENGATISDVALDRLKKIKDKGLDLTNEELANITKKGCIDLSKYRTTFSFRGNCYNATYSPYVINGPDDQYPFFKKLIQLQENTNYNSDKKTYFKRIAFLQEIDGISTSHYLLEKPSEYARCWSSDYGTHGFHRYVGRFPSALIRALINHFGATENDTLLDPFCGSGTTTTEARMLGIPCIGIEISPLSVLISKVKSKFPTSGIQVHKLSSELTSFYTNRWAMFAKGDSVLNKTYDDIIARPGNVIPRFSNIEKWMTKEALLGSSIVIEFIQHKTGYEKDFLCVALSAKMRSIGNVDVDVVRAEYRKEPREKVDVLKIMIRQIQHMAKSINDTINAHKSMLLTDESITLLSQSVLSTQLQPQSISFIITSPPYGVESLSYLRTHLLSFRVLEPILGVDPYNFGNGVIGSEYLPSKAVVLEDTNVSRVSPTYVKFFHEIINDFNNAKNIKRVHMMMNFFEDMYNVVAKFSYWLKNHGKVAFVIGNKKIGNTLIPTDKIIEDIFSSHGFQIVETIAHKLKTNNSNSKVPWQDRIIENEYIMLFQKEED